MTEAEINAVMEAHGRGQMDKALALIKEAMARGDGQAKRVYEQLVGIGRSMATASTVIDRSAITHFLCIAPPSAFAEWNRSKRGPVEVALRSASGKTIWEPLIGVAPDPKEISVASFESEGSNNIEPPLASLGLGRNSGHSFFVRMVMIEDPPGTTVPFVLGVAYRSPQFSVTNGDAPATFSNLRSATRPEKGN